MSVPVGWVLTSGVALAGTISILARMVYNSQRQQIEEIRRSQELQIGILREEIREMRKINSSRGETIKSQSKTIELLQKDISDLKKGCGNNGCGWQMIKSNG